MVHIEIKLKINNMFNECFIYVHKSFFSSHGCRHSAVQLQYFLLLTYRSWSILHLTVVAPIGQN